MRINVLPAFSELRICSLDLDRLAMPFHAIMKHWYVTIEWYENIQKSRLSYVSSLQLCLPRRVCSLLRPLQWLEESISNSMKLLAISRRPSRIVCIKYRTRSTYKIDTLMKLKFLECYSSFHCHLITLLRCFSFANLHPLKSKFVILIWYLILFFYLLFSK